MYLWWWKCLLSRHLWSLICHCCHNDLLLIMTWATHADPQIRGYWISSINGSERRGSHGDSWLMYHIFMGWMGVLKCIWGGSGVYCWWDDVTGARTAHIVNNDQKQLFDKNILPKTLFMFCPCHVARNLAGPLPLENNLKQLNLILVLNEFQPCVKSLQLCSIVSHIHMWPMVNCDK